MQAARVVFVYTTTPKQMQTRPAARDSLVVNRRDTI